MAERAERFQTLLRPRNRGTGLLKMVALALAFILAGLSGPALAGKSAFVVGIDSYANLKPDFQLERPSADAEAVARTLRGLAFSVTLLTRSVTQEEFLRRFADFTSKIEPGDTALLYFAGHGISLEDTNYLLPSDIPVLEPGQELLARTRALAEADLRAAMRERGARVVLMVLDACRDNPFPRRGTRAVGGTRGLAPTSPADGVFTLYSAGSRQQALDRLPGSDPDPNSVFTRIFVKELAKPGQNLIELGESVRDAVAALAETAGLSQVPAYYNEVRGARSIFLGGPASASMSPEPRTAPPLERPTPAPTPAPSRETAARTQGPPGGASPGARSPAMYSYLVGLNPAGDNWLALRSAPAGLGYRIMKMGPDTLLTVVGREGIWNEVRLLSGETGWAHGRYIACCRPAPGR